MLHPSPLSVDLKGGIARGNGGKSDVFEGFSSVGCGSTGRGVATGCADDLSYWRRNLLVAGRRRLSQISASIDGYKTDH